MTDRALVLKKAEQQDKSDDFAGTSNPYIMKVKQLCLKIIQNADQMESKLNEMRSMKNSCTQDKKEYKYMHS